MGTSLWSDVTLILPSHWHENSWGVCGCVCVYHSLLSCRYYYFGSTYKIWGVVPLAKQECVVRDVPGKDNEMQYGEK